MNHLLPRHILLPITLVALMLQAPRALAQTPPQTWAIPAGATPYNAYYNAILRDTLAWDVDRNGTIDLHISTATWTQNGNLQSVTFIEADPMPAGRVLLVGKATDHYALGLPVGDTIGSSPIEWATIANIQDPLGSMTCPAQPADCHIPLLWLVPRCAPAPCYDSIFGYQLGDRAVFGNPATHNPLAQPDPHTSTQAAIYPNPATHSATIRLPRPPRPGATLSIHTTDGRTIHQAPWPSGQQDAQLPVALLPPGIYHVTVQDPSASQSAPLSILPR